VRSEHEFLTHSDSIVSDLGEKRLLREVVKPLLPTIADGIGAGDDAAVVPFPAGCRLVVSSDKIPGDLLAIQFGLMTAREHGRYLVAVSVSDIAAMGATPLGVLLTLALTPDFSVEYLRELIAGAVEAGESWGAPILGGDTGSATAICLSSAAFGYVSAERALTRGGACVGDLVAVSGPVGAFGAALAYFAAKSDGAAPPLAAEIVEGLRQRLVQPAPRVDLAARLLDRGWCTACMDITDGLGQSLAEIGEASGIGFEIDAASVPVHSLATAVAEAMGLDPYELAFSIGLDLELLVTVSPDHVDDARRCGLIPFGSVHAGRTIEFERVGHPTSGLPGRGWEHFSGNVRDFVARTRSL
jgi:thiamine-monophosphate kinase